MAASTWTRSEVPIDCVDKDPALWAIFLTLFDLENRVRAIEGRAAITEAQALQALKDRATQ